MSIHETTQGKLFSEPSGDSLTVETDGRIIRPLFALPDALVDETRVTITDEGLHVLAKDPANVAFVELEAPASAFDAYHLQGTNETTVGLLLDEVTGLLGRARKGATTSDPVAVEVDAQRTLASITREYDQAEATFHEERVNIDPDSIRQTPDVPALDLDWSVTISPQAFADVVDAIDAATDYLGITPHSGGVLFYGGAGEDNGAAVRFDTTPDAIGQNPDEDAASLLSLDYVKSITDGLTTGLVDAVTTQWSQEYPVKFRFERRDSDGDLLYDGQYMQAPRITED